NMSILVRHKPVLKSVLEPFCLCRLSGRNGGQFNRFDAASLHVRAPSPILLICGGPIKVREPKPVSLRQAYTQVYNRTILNEYASFAPEDFSIFAPSGNYQDWLAFESDFAQIVDLIVLFSESYGSIAELGAFAMVEEIAQRLLVVMDDQN